MYDNNPALIQSQEGREPGDLEEVDGAKGYGGTHTERFQPRHNLN